MRELVGSMLYLACSVRPDIMYSVNLLSRFPTPKVWIGLKRILHYLSGALNYSRREDSVILSGFAVSNFVSEVSDGKSVSDFIFKVYDNIVGWCTKKQKCVSHLTTKAEYVSI